MQVTHLNIGKCGEYGIGNQLFQIASTIGIAKAHNIKWAFPKWKNNTYFKTPLPAFAPGAGVVVKEVSFDYFPYSIPKDSFVYMDGYFQSYKYFQDASVEVREALEFNEQLVLDIESALGAVISRQNTCSISVRRGDYVNLQHIHPLQPDSYWSSSQKLLEEKVNIDTYLVFSDDIKWCHVNKHLFNSTGKKVIFFSGRHQFDDLVGITLCKHNIITNSTFSWWGAWLNKNKDKIVIMPKTWFGVAGPWSGPSTGDDLRVKGWITV
jgi:hypothetical protein